MTRPWETIARVDASGSALKLRRRGLRDFLITVDGRVLMTSAAHRSEDALARLACDAIAGRARARVLVGGLGMGYTLRAALDALPADAQIVVAELNAAIADWCRGPLAELTAHALDDRRVALRIADVADVIDEAARGAPGERFDAIILDLYEGPPSSHWMANDPLYGAAAIVCMRAALRVGGALAVWSETPSLPFERELSARGFRSAMHRSGKGASIHVVYLART